MPVPLDEPYFQRLLRGYRGGPARVRVLPYSYTVPPDALAGLERDRRAHLRRQRVAAHVGADRVRRVRPAGARRRRHHARALQRDVDAGAEVHGACLASLRARGVAPIALVDSAALVAARAGDAAGVEARVEAWRVVTRDAGVASSSRTSRDPDLADIDEAIDAALDGTAR